MSILSTNLYGSSVNKGMGGLMSDWIPMTWSIK